MKLTDAILLMLMVILLSFLSECGLFYAVRIDSVCRDVKTETDMCAFVSESFRNACEKKGFESLEDWQKKCRAMWNLSYIGFSSTDAFMGGETSDSSLLYGSWIYKGKKYEVYAYGN